MSAARALAKRALGIAALPFVALAAPFFAIAARTGVGIGLCRRLGFHPLRVHFYSPVPEYESLPASYFTERHDLPGVALDDAALRIELKRLAAFAPECDWPEQESVAGAYYAQNGMFGLSSAALLHAMIRAHGCRRVIEVGGGYSSLVALGALEKAGPGASFTCVEPHPAPWLVQALERAGAQLVRTPAQALPAGFFDALGPGDLLFIDSSHVAKLASDVNHLFLRVIPALKAGVLVHVHDIYIPYEYPAAHFFSDNKQFWNEQYLLQALLSCNPTFEVLMPGWYVQMDLAAEFRAAFPRCDPQRHRRSSSFYFRKLR